MEYIPELHYAYEKFSQAVYLLAIGPGDVRSRLRKAYIEFSLVPEKAIPEPLVEDYQWIMKKITKHDPIAGESRHIATLERMQNRTGAKIAERICYLTSRLEGYYADQCKA